MVEKVNGLYRHTTFPLGTTAFATAAKTKTIALVTDERTKDSWWSETKDSWVGNKTWKRWIKPSVMESSRIKIFWRRQLLISSSALQNVHRKLHLYRWSSPDFSGQISGVQKESWPQIWLWSTRIFRYKVGNSTAPSSRFLWRQIKMHSTGLYRSRYSLPTCF